MQNITDNIQKYNNYKEQMGRLKKAISSEFYLEAISIEYAIVEDRVTSALRHAGKNNPGILLCRAYLQKTVADSVEQI